jgi:RES domain-containing protein
MKLYRLCAANYADLTGEGARLFPGRWNTQDVPCVYTSSSPSLAQLEVMVNIEDWSIFTRRAFVLLTIEANTSKLFTIDQKDLPNNWNQPVVSEETQQFGTRHLANREYVGFIVPSAVTHQETNVILNPLADRFLQYVKIIANEPFELDERLASRTKILVR